MYLLGGAFALKHGFFRSHRRFKTAVVTAFLLGALALQIRYGFAMFLQTLLTYILLALIITLALLIFLPEIKKLEEMQAAVLPLPAALFSERDVKLLERVLSGAKYDTIAREEGIALVTFKKYIHTIFYRIGVSDRTNFLARYSNHKIMREVSSTTVVD
jgi:DNA-binding CsgD family transcriptional regulator